MDSIQKLARIFSDLPGIGPRQAKRFVYFLLTRNGTYIDELINLLKNLKKETSLCSSCFRYFPKNATTSMLCPVCANPNRNETILMVVSRDVDFENMEKTGAYDGKYFILGGSVPILEKEPEKRIRLSELKKAIEARAKNGVLKEIIFAMSANPEGENTGDYLKEEMNELLKKYTIKTSMLGRGLSTGAELEYADGETLTNALKNRQ
jgi:recombination protein RecR